LTAGDLLTTLFLLILVSIPLAISVWALTDAAARPRWVWALTEKNQVAWLAAILLGTLTVLLGLAISIWYLARVRPALRATESGKLE
jgi:hypothetical protein